MVSFRPFIKLRSHLKKNVFEEKETFLFICLRKNELIMITQILGLQKLLNVGFGWEINRGVRIVTFGI